MGSEGIRRLIVLASARRPGSGSLSSIDSLLRLRIDPGKRRVDIEQGEIGNAEIGVALSGGMDCSGDDPRLAIWVAGTRMSVAAMKRLWPVFAAPKVRSWVEEHVQAGVVERLEVATNAPMSTLKTSGPPVPEDGLAIKIVGHGAESDRSQACRRSAMPTSTCASPVAPRHQSRPRQRGDFARP